MAIINITKLIAEKFNITDQELIERIRKVIVFAVAIHQDTPIPNSKAISILNTFNGFDKPISDTPHNKALVSLLLDKLSSTLGTNPDIPASEDKEGFLNLAHKKLASEIKQIDINAKKEQMRRASLLTNPTEENATPPIILTVTETPPIEIIEVNDELCQQTVEQKKVSEPQSEEQRAHQSTTFFETPKRPVETRFDTSSPQSNAYQLPAEINSAIEQYDSLAQIQTDISTWKAKKNKKKDMTLLELINTKLTIENSSPRNDLLLSVFLELNQKGKIAPEDLQILRKKLTLNLYLKLLKYDIESSKKIFARDSLRTQQLSILFKAIQDFVENGNFVAYTKKLVGVLNSLSAERNSSLRAVLVDEVNSLRHLTAALITNSFENLYQPNPLFRAFYPEIDTSSPNPEIKKQKIDPSLFHPREFRRIQEYYDSNLYVAGASKYIYQESTNQKNAFIFNFPIKARLRGERKLSEKLTDSKASEERITDVTCGTVKESLIIEITQLSNKKQISKARKKHATCAIEQIRNAIKLSNRSAMLGSLTNIAASLESGPHFNGREQLLQTVKEQKNKIAYNLFGDLGRARDILNSKTQWTKKQTDAASQAQDILQNIFEDPAYLSKTKLIKKLMELQALLDKTKFRGREEVLHIVDQEVKILRFQLAKPPANPANQQGNTPVRSPSTTLITARITASPITGSAKLLANIEAEDFKHIPRTCGKDSQHPYFDYVASAEADDFKRATIVEKLKSPIELFIYQYLLGSQKDEAAAVALVKWLETTNTPLSFLLIEDIDCWDDSNISRLTPLLANSPQFAESMAAILPLKYTFQLKKYLPADSITKSIIEKTHAAVDALLSIDQAAAQLALEDCREYLPGSTRISSRNLFQPASSFIQETLNAIYLAKTSACQKRDPNLFTEELGKRLTVSRITRIYGVKVNQSIKDYLGRLQVKNPQAELSSTLLTIS